MSDTRATLATAAGNRRNGSGSATARTTAWRGCRAMNLLAFLLFGLLGATGCDRAAAPSAAPESATAEPLAAPADATAMPDPVAPGVQELRLPISLNAVMVALVNHAADPIWLAAWRNPQTDQDWRNLERMAYQLQVAGALLEIPGTGPLDDEWTGNAAWVTLARQLRDGGQHAVDAVKARDVSRISAVGDEIVDICEGCHIAFKPDLPTGGLFGELSPTEADFEE